MKRNPTLVDKAKAITRPLRMPTTAEERALAIAWLRGEVNLSQAARALNPDKPINGTALYRFAVCFRDEYRAGRIKLVA